MTRSRALFALCVVLVPACGGGQKKAKPVERQTAADEILRIAAHWTSVVPEQGLLSPPSAVSMFQKSRASHIVLSRSGGRETLVIEEDLQLRAGGEVHCSTKVENELSVRYGRRHDEAAVEITRPAIHTPRACSGFHPEGALNEAAKTALFVLRADTLVAVEPPLEKRKYLPGTE